MQVVYNRTDRDYGRTDRTVLQRLLQEAQFNLRMARGRSDAPPNDYHAHCQRQIDKIQAAIATYVPGRVNDPE